MRSNKLKPLVIGDITIEHPLALAPMAGVTDLPYRLLCKEQGAGMMCTEMVSAKGLYYGNRKSEPLMATDPKEIPIAIQIFGSDPEIMGQMAAKVNDGRFQMIDINMGCPVPKIVNNGDGSALMKNPELAGKVIKAVVDAVDIPVTVKIRKHQRWHRLHRRMEQQRSQFMEEQENSTIQEQQTGRSFAR